MRLVVLQDFGDLGEPGADEAHQQAGDGDKDDGGQADEAVGFGGDVKDGGELIHQGDDAHRQIGEPDAAVLVKGEQVGPPRQPARPGDRAGPRPDLHASVPSRDHRVF